MPKLLQRLELNGFKSFATKTSFDLSSGITAVVGPNGSGKSNVIDGIRWLLGERDAKNLRGGKGEDLIFAGTAKRPRLGQASASLIFQNVSGFFPAEYSEIVITRQVNRDGTNQYYLNKAEIRLKDLIDFLAQARLGTKGLIVVSQGNSDIFIQATPAGRREMIEEMLGLREYQLKKSEAERRLKNTQINLDKVKALTEEILPHLRSLKRQTSRWEKRDALEQELRMLENHFFGTEYQDLRTKTAQLEDELRGRRTEEERLREARRTAEDELKKVEAAQPEERKELTDIKQRTRGLLEKRSAIQKDLGRLEAQLEIAGVPVSEEGDDLPSAGALFTLVKTIRNKLEAFTEDEVEYEELRDGIREILDDISETLSEGVPARRATPASGPDVREDFEKLNKELTELEKSLSALQEQEKVLEKSQEEFYLRFKVAVAAVETAKGHLEKWDSETQAKNFEKERLSLRLEDWARQVRQTGREPHEFENVTAAPELEGQTREAMEHRLFRLRGELAAIGEVDEALLKEARETETRYQFLSKESEDLEKAKTDLRKLILDLNDKIKTEFSSALHKINIEFDKFFNLMFDGGTAKLKLATPPKPKAAEEKEGEAAPAEEKVKDAVAEEALEDPAVEEGIEIDLKITRKRVNSLEMLSGGERSLVGIAALFALISVSPPPFLVLDEVDAPLDERNARRFSEMLKEFSKDTQFILVTHNRATMEAADVLYGITLNDDGTSKAVSLKLEKA